MATAYFLFYAIIQFRDSTVLHERLVQLGIYSICLNLVFPTINPDCVCYMYYTLV